MFAFLKRNVPKTLDPARQFQLTILIIAAYVSLVGKSLVLLRHENQKTKFTYYSTFLNGELSGAPFSCRATSRYLRHHFAEECGKPVALRITPGVKCHCVSAMLATVR
ncbi:hypothetical protein PsorP6_010103 [Peronosclerospora sorghi]|uniref:Uncharacterized protein n=1 Tax=Peronosclerospora sorghi TaxID=230839 RepID=A0ACC0VXL7_9STRA|nr:hypothetical protein PsorP6_010103 [Peronosclerospora sorghi]